MNPPDSPAAASGPHILHVQDGSLLADSHHPWLGVVLAGTAATQARDAVLLSHSDYHNWTSQITRE